MIDVEKMLENGYVDIIVLKTILKELSDNIDTLNKSSGNRMIWNEDVTGKIILSDTEAYIQLNQTPVDINYIIIMGKKLNNDNTVISIDSILKVENQRIYFDITNDSGIYLKLRNMKNTYVTYQY